MKVGDMSRLRGRRFWWMDRRNANDYYRAEQLDSESHLTDSIARAILEYGNQYRVTFQDTRFELSLKQFSPKMRLPPTQFLNQSMRNESDHWNCYSTVITWWSLIRVIARFRSLRYKDCASVYSIKLWTFGKQRLRTEILKIRSFRLQLPIYLIS